MSTSPKPADIKAAREKAGLTQTASATLVHATLSAWQRWEAGERRMRASDWELFNLKTKGAQPDA